MRAVPLAGAFAAGAHFLAVPAIACAYLLGVVIVIAVLVLYVMRTDMSFRLSRREDGRITGFQFRRGTEAQRRDGDRRRARKAARDERRRHRAARPKRNGEDA